MAPLRVTEANTRYGLIDPQLKKAGGNLTDRTQVAFEIPVAGYDGSVSEGFTDYCLYKADGEVIAVVEAKRTSRDARVGKQQLLQYLDGIQKKQSLRPFGFMANGEEVFFWDSEAAAERQVAGFFSPENLERLLSSSKTTSRSTAFRSIARLSIAPIRQKLSGVSPKPWK